MLLTTFTYANEDTTLTFVDVPEDHWAYNEIHKLRDLKITDGIGNNMFGLGMVITRGELAAFLVKLMKWEPISPGQGSFLDNMDPNKWYYQPIETALQHDVVSKEEKFRPTDPITREEMAVMLVRTLGYKTLAEQLNSLESPFEDVSSNIGYITVAKDFGIINGIGNGLFKPNDTAKREEAAAMMMRMYKKLIQPISELHGFYAIKSAGQAHMIKDFDSVGFGWSRLEYDGGKDEVILNTSKANNNDYAIPQGYEGPLSMAKDNGVRKSLMVLASNNTIITTKDGSNIPLIQYVLNDAEKRSQAIDVILSQVINPMDADGTLTMDGVVIDFEDMRGEALREAFNVFLKELKAELDNGGKYLYVAVHPARKHGQAYYDGYDYKAIGDMADKVILMAHDYYAKQLTEAEMDMGYTITPVSPIDEVYYALKAITDEEKGVKDRSKIWIQLSFDAVQWKLKEGKVINKYPYNPSYEAIQKRLVMEGVTINYSERYQNPYATFFDANDGTDNIIWYEDSRSIQSKIDLAKMFGIEGVSLWRLGNIPDYQEDGNKKIYMDVWKRILENKR